MARLIALAQRLAILPIALAATALFTLMVMTFFDVVLRSLFNHPIEAATELTRILMAVIVFSVMPVISARGEHISVDLTDGLFFHFGLHRWRDGAINLISGVLMYWPVMRVWTLAERWRSYGDTTEYLHIPQFYIGWFIAAFAALTGLVLVVLGLTQLFAPRLLEAAK